MWTCFIKALWYNKFQKLPCQGRVCKCISFYLASYTKRVSRSSHIRRRHLSQEGGFSLISAKTRSWNGIWGIQRALWPWQTWKISQVAIGNQIGQSWKNSVIRITRKPLEPDLKLKIQLLAEFCHPSCDMNFADPRKQCESLCIKPTTQRNLKHPVPSVRALSVL